MKKLIVQTDKLKNNIQKIRALAGEAAVIAVLKGNGYGLGICQAADLYKEQGITLFAVSELSEALTLRGAGFEERVLLLSPTCDPGEAMQIVENRLIATIGSELSARVLDEACAKLQIRCEAHIKIDTGFGRFGFLYTQPDEAVRVVSALQNVDVKGTFSHLSNSFGRAEDCRRQFERFTAVLSHLKQSGVNTGMRHICNSCAFLRFEEMHLDAVRVGSAFLGRLPIDNTHGLERIGYLHVDVCETKILPKGFNVGYANVYTTKRPTKIAVIPAGYKDGYGVKKIDDAFRISDIIRYIYHNVLLFFSKRALFVKIDGRSCPLIGRISMFNIVADVTGTQIGIGSTAALDCNPILIDSSIPREYI